ncbi:LytR family transcriptional regulator [Streptococcus caprae]|uniref:LytR family transcriptional regulator n=1 Tax=Streptococcus caprae TaxID=1640501 RepID=A0ABV8CTJ4_9STRE
MTESRNHQVYHLEVLTSIYAYHQASILAEKMDDLHPDYRNLLQIMKERMELNIQPSLEQTAHFSETYGLKLAYNPPDKEQEANYLMVLESQLRNHDILNFVRGVSPIIYRLFMRLAKGEIAELDAYIHDTKDDKYDTWKFEQITPESPQALQDFAKKWHDPRLTSTSLMELLTLTQLPSEVKQIIRELRQLEKSIRNPLAHLIRPFDEQELHRTTKFSSQDFLDKLIALARHAGIIYPAKPFLCDQVNQVLQKLLEA